MALNNPAQVANLNPPFFTNNTREALYLHRVGVLYDINKDPETTEKNAIYLQHFCDKHVKGAVHISPVLNKGISFFYFEQRKEAKKFITQRSNPKMGVGEWEGDDYPLAFKEANDIGRGIRNPTLFILDDWERDDTSHNPDQTDPPHDFQADDSPPADSSHTDQLSQPTSQITTYNRTPNMVPASKPPSDVVTILNNTLGIMVENVRSSVVGCLTKVHSEITQNKQETALHRQETALHRKETLQLSTAVESMATKLATIKSLLQRIVQDKSNTPNFMASVSASVNSFIKETQAAVAERISEEAESTRREMAEHIAELRDLDSEGTQTLANALRDALASLANLGKISPEELINSAALAAAPVAPYTATPIALPAAPITLPTTMAPIVPSTTGVTTITTTVSNNHVNTFAAYHASNSNIQGPSYAQVVGTPPRSPAPQLDINAFPTHSPTRPEQSTSSPPLDNAPSSTHAQPPGGSNFPTPGLRSPKNKQAAIDNHYNSTTEEDSPICRKKHKNKRPLPPPKPAPVDSGSSSASAGPLTRSKKGQPSCPDNAIIPPADSN